MWEDWSHRRNKGFAKVYQTDQPLRLRPQVSFEIANIFTKWQIFVFDTKQKYLNIWKMKFLSSRKLSSLPPSLTLKFKFTCRMFPTSLILKLITKSVGSFLKWGRSTRWCQCCDVTTSNETDTIDRSRILQSRNFFTTKRRLTSKVGLKE